MNTFTGKRENGASFIALTLEPGNLTRLQAGRPIKVRIEDFFPDGMPGRLELFIGFTETPVADGRELAKHAEVVLDERTLVAEQLRAHCPECKSTIEQIAVKTSDESPILLVLCSSCGCLVGVLGKDVLETKS
jgi:hypothetical protein